MKTIVFQDSCKFTQLKAQRHKGIFIALLAVILLMGCDQPDTDTGSLHGTWSDGFGKIEIDTSEKNIENDSGFGFFYKGSIENNPDFTATAGVLIIKFTQYIDWDGDDVPANVNKFGALYWNELAANSALMADANTDGGFTHVIIETFQEAQDAFTLDKVGEYVDWSILGAYTK